MPRPIATFDVSAGCPLRCAHCYFFAAPAPAQLDEDVFLARLPELRDRYGIRSAFWIGGEPLLRPRLLARGLEVFARNAISTSAQVPIPADLRAGLLVSIDGPPELHDRLRGPGAFDRALRHIAPLPSGSFALSLTLTAWNLQAIESLPELVRETRALGAVVGFHVGPPGDPLRVDGAERDGAVDRLLAVARAHPGAILTTAATLELYRPARAQALRRQGIYQDRAIAFDVALGVKLPCTFGERASCDACGCPVVAAQAARALGDRESDALLRRLFARRAAC